MAGKDEWERAKVNEVVDFEKDVYNELMPYHYAVMGWLPGDTEALYRDVFVPGVTRFFPVYKKLLRESGSGFFAPSGVTFVDFIVADYLQQLEKYGDPKVFDGYPELKAFVDKVHALPELENYLATRNMAANPQ